MTLTGARVAETGHLEIAVAFVCDVQIPLRRETRVVLRGRPVSHAHVTTAPFEDGHRAATHPRVLEHVRESGWFPDSRWPDLTEWLEGLRDEPVFRTFVEVRFDFPDAWIRKQLLGLADVIYKPELGDRHRYSAVEIAVEATRRIAQAAAWKLGRWGHADPSLQDVHGAYSVFVLRDGKAISQMMDQGSAASLLETPVVEDPSEHDLGEVVAAICGDNPEFSRIDWAMRAYRLRAEGRLDEAAVAWFAAIEGHLYQVLDLLLREEGVDHEERDERLRRLDHIRRVLPELQRRLGGPASDWQWAGDGALGALGTRLYTARNDVVHLSIPLSRDRYRLAEKSASRAADFINRRLSDPPILKKYPKTALTLLTLEELAPHVGRGTLRDLEALAATQPFWEGNE